MGSKNNRQRVSASLEDYLEAILNLEETHRVARAKDIAQSMGVSRASVTTALKSLSAKGLVNYEPYGYTTLTAEGRALGEEVRRRHSVLKRFFQEILLMTPEHSELNACRVEHAMDARAMDRLVKFLSFVELCPRTGPKWKVRLENYLSGKDTLSDCLGCSKSCSEDQPEGLC